MSDIGSKRPPSDGGQIFVPWPNGGAELFLGWGPNWHFVWWDLVNWIFIHMIYCLYCVVPNLQLYQNAYQNKITLMFFVAIWIRCNPNKTKNIKLPEENIIKMVLRRCHVSCNEKADTCFKFWLGHRHFTIKLSDVRQRYLTENQMMKLQANTAKKALSGWLRLALLFCGAQQNK